MKVMLRRRATVEELEDEVQRLREALGFYADHRNWRARPPKGREWEYIWDPSLVAEDQGMTAREALG